MAKPRTPKDNQEKDLQDKIRKRLTGLFSGGEEPPTYMSIRQVDELKAHIAELEAKLGQKEPVISQNAATPGEEIGPEALPIKPAVVEKRLKRISLWAAGIFAAFSLVLLLFSFYMVNVVGKGQPDLSDKTLEPVAGLMIIASLISFYLIRRDRLVTAAWILLSIVIIPPIPAVLVLNDIFVVMILYIAVLAPVLIAWVLPKTARRQAINATGASILVLIGIQVWNPAFRLGSSTLPSFTTYIIVLAALAILGFFIRQALVGSIRTKLVLAFVAIAIGAVGSVSFIVDRSLRTSRTDEIGNNLTVLANSEALQVGQSVENEFKLLNGLALTREVQQRAEIGTQEDMLTQAEINQLDQQWRAADAADNNNDPLVSKVLYDGLSAELLKFQAKFPEHVEIFLTDLPGVSLATTDRTSDYLQSDEEWWQTAYKDGQYIGQPAYDPSSKTLSINMAVPVRATGSNRIVGVLRTTVNINSLSNVLIAGLFGQTGQTDIYLPDGQIVILTPSGNGKFELTEAKSVLGINQLNQPSKKYLELPVNGVPSLLSVSGVMVPSDSNQYTIIKNLNWQVVVHQAQAEALKPVETQTQNDLLLAILVTILAAIAAVGLAQVLAGPIIRLNTVAEKVASGDLSVVAKVESGDETGTLALTFNNMISQLRGLIGTLEQRVADRTHDLELAAEVGRSVSEKSVDIDALLSKAVELIGDRFNLYYTQVYLTDSTGRNLILRAGTGEVGSELLARAHHLPIVSGSINGRAAAEKHSVIVADTQQSPDFKPNPLLPDTRSEIAIPLIASGQVVGVLDMQSDRPDTLSETNLPAFEALAGQLAIAIQNAALFTETEQARAEVETQVHRLTEQGWQDFLDAIEHGERMGFAFNQSNVVRLEGESISTLSSEGLSVPISVTGTKIGAIQFAQEPGRIWTAGETELIESTATQLAQHIENLRLLAQTERYRAQAEEVARRLTREGWNTLQIRGDIAPGYIYDLNEVRRLPENHNGSHTTALKQQLRVHNENIGELTVDSCTNSEEAAEIISAVAEQLSGHIENLRLTELNEKRAYELATVATVSTTASTVLDPDKLLQSVVDLTKERFGLYHVHIYLADDTWKTLLLTAGAGEIGQKMVAQEHSIAMDAERSLVARAARERQDIIVNDVHSEPDFLPNPLLPDTKSEMAVPMIAGDKVLGVFDVQSDKLSGFSKEDASIYTTLASQVAVALQNARLYVAQSATVTQLRELDRLKSAFLANMSHELRTPLNSILGFSDVILEQIDGPLTDPMKNDLQLIQKNGQHLLHLINDVLDMAKIEAGRINLAPERFTVHEIMDDVLSITSTLASERNLSLYVEPDSESDIEIFADRTRLRQVMINLINNSIKFTEKGRIAIRASRQGTENILIRVKDTGVGIPSDKLETIFQEFAQIDTSSTRKAGGTGLGLPISRRLIELHGGRLWAESSGVPGEGSTFYVELPIEAKITEPIERQEK